MRFDGLFWRLAQRDDLLIEAISRCLDVGFWVSYLYMIIHVYTMCVKINIIYIDIVCVLTQRVSSKKNVLFVIGSARVLGSQKKWSVEMANYGELKWIGNELGASGKGLNLSARPDAIFPNPWPVHQDWGGVPQSTPPHSRAKQTPS